MGCTPEPFNSHALSQKKNFGLFFFGMGKGFRVPDPAPLSQDDPRALRCGLHKLLGASTVSIRASILDSQRDLCAWPPCIIHHRGLI